MSPNNNAVTLGCVSVGTTVIDRQVRALTQFATCKGIKVITAIILPHCSPSEYEKESHVAVLLGRNTGHDDMAMILITDVSQLRRPSRSTVMSLIRRLAEAGVFVLMPGLSVPSDGLRHR